MCYNILVRNEQMFDKRKATKKMKKFEIGKTYSMRSACDHECVWSYKVVDRTAQTITLTDGKKTLKCRIIKVLSECCNAESVYPLGKYSMCPILRA